MESPRATGAPTLKDVQLLMAVKFEMERRVAKNNYTPKTQRKQRSKIIQIEKDIVRALDIIDGVTLNRR